MDSTLISTAIIPLIASSMVLGGLLSISFLQLPIIRKSVRIQTEQEIYSRIMEEGLNSEVLMAKKAQYSQRGFCI